MKVYVYNKNFEAIAYVDMFKSFIWTDRYKEAGEFELSVEASYDNLIIFQQDYYLTYDQSEHVMIIESISLESNTDEGDNLIISGRSLESLIDRRIVWEQITFSAGKSVQAVIKKLLTDAFMTKGDRLVSNFKFVENKELATLPKITDNTDTNYGAQYTGDNIYDILIEFCQLHQIGFKITIDDDWHFNFMMYKGVDRSYDNKNNNPYVVFSPTYQNILNSSYIESKKTLRNITLVAGEGEGKDRKTETYTLSKSDYKGIGRRELYTDARDISSTISKEDGSSTTISNKEYKQLLIQRGKEKLAENKETKAFDGEVDALSLFVYGKDFYLGDVVEVCDPYGNERKSRIIEIVYSHTTSVGYTVYPTFEIVDDDEEE